MTPKSDRRESNSAAAEDDSRATWMTPKSDRRESNSAAADDDDSRATWMTPNSMLLLSPRVSRLKNSVARGASQRPPSPIGDWRSALDEAVKALPQDIKLTQLVECVAKFAPDRGAKLLQVVEEEVAVMADVAEQAMLEHLQHEASKQEAKLQALEKRTWAARTAALEADRRLMELLPDFQWERYLQEPGYLERQVLMQINPDYADELEKIEELTKQYTNERNWYKRELEKLQSRREMLKKQVAECFGANVEAAKREHQLLRERYAKLLQMDEERKRKLCPPQ